MRKKISVTMRLLMMGLMGSIFTIQAANMKKNSEVQAFSDESSPSYGEKLQMLQVLKDIRVLIEHKLQEGSRAPRWDAPCPTSPGYPVPPRQFIDSELLEEIKCIACLLREQLTDCCENLSSQIESVGEQIKELDLSIGVDLIETLVESVGSQLEVCCEDLSSQIESIGEQIKDLDLSIGVDLIETLVESVGSQLEECCETMGSKIDSLEDHVIYNTTLIESVGDQIRDLEVSCDVGVVETMVESVGSQLDVCCEDLSSRIDSVGDQIRNLEVSCDVGVVETLVESVGSQLDVCCEDLSSQIESVGDQIRNLDISCDVGVVETLVESVGSQLDECCEDLSSRVESVGGQVEDVQYTADLILEQANSIEFKIGEPDQTVDFDLLPTNTQETNDATYSVIQWLKAIYYELNNEV